MAKKQILVLFGPSGSGKSFFQGELCRDPRFETIKKASTREPRMGGMFRMFIVNDSSAKFGGRPNQSANYFTEIDGADGELVTYNYGETYSVDLADIDSAFVQGKTPIIILRTREQFE